MRAPYGTWPSPLSARDVSQQGVRLGEIRRDGAAIYWIESRPLDGGRYVLVRRDPSGEVVDVGPGDFNARTRVHEYGGGAVTIANGEIYASNFRDQRLYRLHPAQTTSAGQPHATAVPITPEGPWRYADGVIDSGRRRLFAVREDHGAAGREPITTLVAIPLDGDAHEGNVVVSGHDFYAAPRLSPDGKHLTWLAWRHPQMPWDGTELWVADVVDDDGQVTSMRLVAGGPNESIYQPGWTLGGELVFASDRDGWWRLYRTGPTGAEPPRPVVAQPPPRAEFGRPMWSFGSASWACAGPERLVTSYVVDGAWHLGLVDLSTGSLVDVPTELQPGESLAANETQAWLIAGSARTPSAVTAIDLRTGEATVLRASSSLSLAPADTSVPETLEFPTAGGRHAHAFYYPPTNARASAAPGGLPPLLVIGHGGPTSATSALFDVRIQFWTTRGFAVVDVNYGGSSGFGREYRQRLGGQWGIVDVEDMVGAVRALVSRDKADPARVFIRGGSAGGFTVLAALTTHPGVFAAGANYYGVSDLEALATDTHKFESRYLDGLVGPYPEARDIYRARSPIHHVDRLACPLIVFQGLEDKVVPPSQSEAIVRALQEKGVRVEYHAFEGEQHGFRKAETIATCLERELAFYGSVCGFAPADSSRQSTGA